MLCIKQRPSHSFFTVCNSASIHMNPFSNSSRSQWALLDDFMYTILGRQLHVLGKNFSIGWIARLTRLRCFSGFLCLRSSFAAFTLPKASPKWIMGLLIKHDLFASMLMQVTVDLVQWLVYVHICGYFPMVEQRSFPLKMSFWIKEISCSMLKLYIVLNKSKSLQNVGTLKRPIIMKQFLKLICCRQVYKWSTNGYNALPMQT